MTPRFVSAVESRLRGGVLLAADGLRCALGGRSIVRDVSVTVRAGEIVGIIGPNGGGKTTLLRLIAGILSGPGTVLLGEKDLRQLSYRERAARVAYLPQVREVPVGFRACELVELGCHPRRDGAAACGRAVADALRTVGAAELANRPLETLSGGELQKVFLASVVAQQAPLLLLDEPTVFLDPGRALELEEVFVGLAAESRGLVIVTHDLDFLGRCASRVIGLRGGGVLFTGPPADVLSPTALAELYDVPLETLERVGGGPLISLSPSVVPTPPRGGGIGGPALRPAEHRDLPRPPSRRAMGGGAGRRGPALQLLVAVSLAVVLVAPFVGGAVDWNPTADGAANSAARFILLELRIPRVLLAAASGAALALAGAAFQALFRNPLATPYTLGVASGASFGAVLALVAGASFSFAGSPPSSLGAVAGAVAICAAAYALSRRRGALPTATLLLAGVTLSFFFSALILLLQYVADFAHTFRALRWLMGEVRIVGFAPLALFAPLLAGGGLLVIRRRAELNHLLTGEELAQARGVPVERVKLELFLGCSMMVGAVVALCGPIGFVGLIVPHALRSVIGQDQRRLTLASVPAGAAFLVVCDTVARLALSPAELPVGVVTALLGGPFFLAILLRAKTLPSG